ncbi:MAG: nucleotidyltransferase domain-containing protein [Sandaracinaceae bacterium]|nr:nucleotidyltransferase domain-containing protein [Sandaracinaceae bacterium]
MSVTPRAAGEALVDRARRARERREAAEREARERAQSIAHALRDEHGADAVYLFGSLAWGGFHDGSDIDLAVVGLTPRALALAAADAEAIADRSVTLLDLDDAPASLQQRIQERGVRLA